MREFLGFIICSILGTIIIAVLVVITEFESCKAETKAEQRLEEIDKEIHTETFKAVAEPPRVVTEDVEETEDDGDPFTSIPLRLTQGEMDLLESIAMAEAEGEDSKGKALVMRVVLNRAIMDGKGLDEVIYKAGQFCTERMGIEPDEDCHEALALVIDGWDESQGALHFHSEKYPDYGEPLFQYGGHYFSK